MEPKKKGNTLAYLTAGGLIGGALLVLIGMLFQRTALGQLCWFIGLAVLFVSIVMNIVLNRKAKKQQKREDEEAKKW